MTTVIEKYKHYNICENNNYLEFSLLHKKDDYLYRSIIQPVFCKDYFQDVFKSMYLKKDFDEIIYDIKYQYNEEENVFNNTHFHMLIGTVLPKTVYGIGTNIDEIFQVLEKALNFKTFSSFTHINHNWKIDNISYECSHNKKAAEKITTPGLNYTGAILCTLSIEWLRFPWLCSFLFDFLRNIYFIRHADVVKHLNSLIEVDNMLTVFAKISFQNIELCLNVYENLMKYGYENLKPINAWDTDLIINTKWHNTSGYASNSAEILKAFEKIKNNKIVKNEIEECIDRV